MRANVRIDLEQLLAASTAVALDLGLAAVTTETVATRCRASVHAVHRLQPDEARLVADTFTRITRAEMLDTRRVVLAYPSPVEQLRALLEGIAEPGDGELDTIWVQSWGLGKHNALLAEAIREQEAAWHRLLTAVLRRGIESGEFLPVDASEFADQVLAVSVAVNAYSILQYGTDPDRLRLLTSIVRTGLGVQLNDPTTHPEAAGV